VKCRLEGWINWNCLDPDSCRMGACERAVRKSKGQADEGDAQSADPLDPEALPSDFQRARDSLLHLITTHANNNNPDIKAAVIAGTGLMMVGDALKQVADAVQAAAFTPWEAFDNEGRERAQRCPLATMGCKEPMPHSHNSL
jgi:hypothetical protein